MTKLPRGFIPSNQDTPIATARWALLHEIAAYEYKDGDIWLGVLPVPHPDAVEPLGELDGLRVQIETHPTLEPEWRQQTLNQLEAHSAALNATDELAVGIHDDRHLVSKGGTRAGKGTTAIVPNLCFYPGSVICIDPKGENAKLTASRRGMGSRHCDGLGQSVAVIDPYDTTKLGDDFKASWNPLDLLDLDDALIVDRASSIAEALVVRSNSEHAHFDENARSLIKALILYVAQVHAGRADRTLITVYDYLMRGAHAQMEADRASFGPQPDDPDAFTYLLYLMKRREEFGGILAGAAETILAMGQREKGSVLSTARRNMEFIERPAMQAVLQSSSFSLDDIKRDARGLSIYLCLPAHRMPDCGRWFRLVVNSCLNRMYEIDEAPATGHPVLFLLEEFASLQTMEIIEHAAGYAAGFGIKLWVIIQDINQLKRYYKDGWETFLGNAGVIQAFANSDNSSLEFLSKKLGETEVTLEVRNVNTALTASTNDPGQHQRFSALLQARSPLGLLTAPMNLMVDPSSTGQSASSSTAYNQTVQKTPLLLPDEIERTFKREHMNQLVAIKGEAPFILQRTNYFDHPRFAGLFDPIRPPFDTKAEALARQKRQLADRAAQRQETIKAVKEFLKETGRALAKTKRR
ncbi:MAG: type IV secretory system conjugative DNA transfer family protein [Devosia sp.]